MTEYEFSLVNVSFKVKPDLVVPNIGVRITRSPGLDLATCCSLPRVH